MGKLTNPRMFIVAIALLFCISVALLFKLFLHRDISAAIRPSDIVIGEVVCFADSTENAKQWLWEFGDGGKSIMSRSGCYRPKKIGLQLIKLTVDGKFTKQWMINVRQRVTNKSQTVITIDAPLTAMQGEYVTFTGNGNAKEWKWMLGETGKVDSHDRVAIYAYSKPGKYEIQLSTETTEYPIRQTIEVAPNTIPDLNPDANGAAVRLKIGNDICERLQAIADGKSFNNNYNYILYRYLGKNPNFPVIVNNAKQGNSFWSYCQGLRIMDSKGAKIRSVIIGTKDEKSTTITKLIVMQDAD
jgi:hypothetical protein